MAGLVLFLHAPSATALPVLDSSGGTILCDLIEQIMYEWVYKLGNSQMSTPYTMVIE